MYAIHMHRNIYICLCVYVFSESPWTAIRKYNMFCGLIIDVFYSRVCDVQGHTSTIYGSARIYLSAWRLSIIFLMHHHIIVMRFFYFIIFIRWLNFIVVTLPIWPHQNIITSHRTNLLVQLQWGLGSRFKFWKDTFNCNRYIHNINNVWVY